METKDKHYSNSLGVRGWFWAGNYKMERYLYVIHRITGIGMVLFFMAHLIETTFFRIQGEAVWQKTIDFLKQPLFEVGLMFVYFAFVFHALNGLRLILQEFGFTLGKPKRPVYPFSDALRRRRGFAILTITIIIILLPVFFLNSLVGGG